MTGMEPILTPRLALIPLTAFQLKEYLSGSQPSDPASPQISFDLMTATLQRAVQMKIDKLEKSSLKAHPWITYWLIQIQVDGFGAGLIGFKGAPDPEGQVEIGYGIDPSCRNLGYTSEAVLALARWAFRDRRCRSIIAPNTLRSNPASNRVLQKCGFKIYHETEASVFWILKRDDFLEDHE